MHSCKVHRQEQVRETADRPKDRAASLDRSLEKKKRADTNYKFMKGKSLHLGQDTHSITA